MPIKGHRREPAAGKRTYHKASIGEAARGISRSHIGNISAGPQAITTALRRPFCSRRTTRAWRPFSRGRTKYPSGGCFDCAYGFAQHDIIYKKHFWGVSANEKTATGDNSSMSPLAVDVNVCSCKIRVSKTCAYLCACKHTCAVVCNKCSSHCFSPQSIAKQYKRIV